jgi:hypothetical protein
VQERRVFLIVFIGGIVLMGLLVLSVSVPREDLGWGLSLGVLVRRLGMIGMFFVNLFQNKVFYFVFLLFVFLWGAVTFIHKKGLFNKKIGFWVVFGFILVLILVWILLLFSKKIAVYNSYLNTVPAGEIYGEKEIGQTFKAEYDDLCALEVLMANYARKVTGEIIFHFKRGIGDSEDLLQKRVDAEKIKDNRYFRYKLPDLENSKGKNYYFYFEAPEASPGNALTVWANDDDKYLEGQKVINGEAAQGDLIFKTVYDKKLGEKVKMFLNEITREKPFPLNKDWFYVGFTGLFLLSCSLFLTYLFKIFKG